MRLVIKALCSSFVGIAAATVVAAVAQEQDESGSLRVPKINTNNRRIRRKVVVPVPRNDKDQNKKRHEVFTIDSPASESLIQKIEDHDFWSRILVDDSMSSYVPPIQMPVDTNDCQVPAPFNDQNNTIHVITRIDTGDFVTGFLQGMSLQSDLIPYVDQIKIKSADGEETAMGTLVNEAVVDGANMIITMYGSSESLCPAITEAISAGVTVLSFDLGTSPGTSCADGHLLTAQSDIDIANLVLDQAAEEYGTGTNVGYVTDLSFQPLKNREEVWEKSKAKYGWEELFAIENAVQGYNTSEALCDAIADQLREYPDTTFIYAPYNYLAETALCGISQPESSAVVFGADISDTDINLMTVPPGESRWKATAGGLPGMMGAALVRMSLIQRANDMSGMGKNDFVTIPSFLFTQDFLLENGITELASLCSAMPELELQDLLDAKACWITSVTCSDIYS